MKEIAPIAAYTAIARRLIIRDNKKHRTVIWMLSPDNLSLMNVPGYPAHCFSFKVSKLMSYFTFWRFADTDHSRPEHHKGTDCSIAFAIFFVLIAGRTLTRRR